MPAAMARIARITAKPPIEMNADRPVRMSQILNNRKPIFFVNFMVIILSFLLFRENQVPTHITTITLCLHPSTGECYSPPLGGDTETATTSIR
jgi:hypothetical protein